MAFRPATPGTILSLAAAVLLLIVTLSVPYLKSVYFLTASVSASHGVQGVNDATFGVFGYCVGNTCSNSTLGYEFNPNSLLGLDGFIHIPTVLVKWLTYALVLHPVALGVAALAFIVGLLAHFREMSGSCFTSCLSSLAATLTLVAFGFDLALFVIAEKRINSVHGASASLGNALWLTLVAWILLFLAGFSFCCSRCSSRRRGPRGHDRPSNFSSGPAPLPASVGAMGGESYADQMRMDAIRAENDRKRRQANSTSDSLPKFAEYEVESIPLRAADMNEDVWADDHHGHLAYSDVGAGGGGLYRDGSVVPGVGAGYGRRPTQRGGGAMAGLAGAAGPGMGVGMYDQPYHPPVVIGGPAHPVPPGRAGYGAHGQSSSSISAPGAAFFNASQVGSEYDGSGSGVGIGAHSDGPYPSHPGGPSHHDYSDLAAAAGVGAAGAAAAAGGGGGGPVTYENDGMYVVHHQIPSSSASAYAYPNPSDAQGGQGLGHEHENNGHEQDISALSMPSYPSYQPSPSAPGQAGAGAGSSKARRLSKGALPMLPSTGIQYNGASGGTFDDGFGLLSAGGSGAGADVGVGGGGGPPPPEKAGGAIGGPSSSLSPSTTGAGGGALSASPPSYTSHDGQRGLPALPGQGPGQGLGQGQGQGQGQGGGGYPNDKESRMY